MISPKFLLMRLATLCGTFLPPWAVRLIATTLSFFAFLLLKTQRRHLARNLSYITTRSDTKRLVLKTFQNFGISLAHFLVSPTLRERILTYCEFNISSLIAATKQGRAVILLTAHLGNWELAGLALGKLGLPLAVIAEPLGGGLFKTYNYYRHYFGIEVIPYNQPRKLLEAIARKRIIVFLADRSLSGKGIACPFFGRRRIFPRGPAYFGLKYRLPIIPGYIVLKKSGRRFYWINTGDEIKISSTGDLKKDVEELTHLIARLIENWVREYPTQWFVFDAQWLE